MFTTLYFSIPLGLGTAYLLERSRRKKDENNISSYFISRFGEESYRDVFNNSPRRVVDYFARPEIIKFYK